MKRFKLLIIVVTLFIAHNRYLPNAISQENEEKLQTVDSPIKERIANINDILNKYPLKSGSNYSQETKVSLRANGKLIIVTQYKTTIPCVTTREEIFLNDIDPDKLSIIAKDNYLALVLSCKSGKENCAQRFFRDSCNITFNPQDYLTNVNIITSASYYNAEQIIRDIKALININLRDINKVEDKAFGESAKNNNEIISVKQKQLKKNRVLTREDFEVIHKPKYISNKKDGKNKLSPDKNAIDIIK